MEKKIARGIMAFLFLFLLTFGGAETENLWLYVLFVGGVTAICIIALVILAARGNNPQTAIEIILANQKVAKRRRGNSNV